MAFSTAGSQTVPVPINVTQETNVALSGNIRPSTYNKSHSGGRSYLSVVSASTQGTAAERACILSVTGGVMGAITIYDNVSAASGTVIYGNPSPIAGLVVSLNIPVANGVTIVTAVATNCVLSFE